MATALESSTTVLDGGIELIRRRRGTGPAALPLGPGRHTIGSDPACDVPVDAAGVQPQHCLLIVSPHRTIAKALSPLTWINDGPFTEAALRAGDRLIVGPVEFTVRFRQGAAEVDRVASAPAGAESSPRPVVRQPESAAELGPVSPGRSSVPLLRLQADSVESEPDQEQNAGILKILRDSPPFSPSSSVSSRGGLLTPASVPAAVSPMERETSSAETAGLRDEIARQSADLAALRAERDEIARTLEGVLAERDRARDLEGALATSRQEIERLQSDLAEAQVQARGSAEAVAERPQLQGRIAELETTVQNLQQASTVTRSVALERDKSALLQQRAELLSMRREVQEKLNEQHRLALDIEEARRALQADAEEARNRHREVEEELSRVERLVQQVGKEREEVAVRERSLAEERTVLQTRESDVASRHEAAGALLREIDEKRRELEEAERRAEELIGRADDIRREAQELDESRRAYEAHALHVESEMSRLESVGEEHVRLQAEMEGRLSEILAREAALSAERETWIERLTGVDVREADLHSREGEVRQQLVLLESAKADHLSRDRELQERHSAIEAAWEELRRRLSEFEDRARQIEEDGGRIEEAREALRRGNDELASQRQQLQDGEREIGRLRAEAERLLADIEAREAKLTGMAAREAALRTQWETYESAVRELETARGDLDRREDELAAAQAVRTDVPSPPALSLLLASASATPPDEGNRNGDTDLELDVIGFSRESLGQRERELDDRLDALSMREERLEQREAELRSREQRLADREEELADQATSPVTASDTAARPAAAVEEAAASARLSEQEDELRLRSEALELRERELDSRDAELRGFERRLMEREERLHQAAAPSVPESVSSAAVAAAAPNAPERERQELDERAARLTAQECELERLQQQLGEYRSEFLSRYESLEREREELTTERRALAEREQELAGQLQELAGQRLELAEQRAALEEQADRTPARGASEWNEPRGEESVSEDAAAADAFSQTPGVFSAGLFGAAASGGERRKDFDWKALRENLRSTSEEHLAPEVDEPLDAPSSDVWPDAGPSGAGPGSIAEALSRRQESRISSPLFPSDRHETDTPLPSDGELLRDRNGDAGARAAAAAIVLEGGEPESDQAAEEAPSTDALELRAHLADLFGIDLSRRPAPTPVEYGDAKTAESAAVAEEEDRLPYRTADRYEPSYRSGASSSSVSPEPPAAEAQDDDIASYMERLLARTRRAAAEQPPAILPSSPAASPAVGSAAASGTGPASALVSGAGGLSSINLALLRSAAPRPVDEEAAAPSVEEEVKPQRRPLQREELDAIRGSMDSFRELANRTARAAVARHQLAKLRQGVSTKAMILGLSGVISAVLLLPELFGNDRYRHAAIGCLCVTLIAALEWFRTRLRIRKLDHFIADADESRQLAEEAAANEGKGEADG